MNISFFGAAQEVTGSCFLLETNEQKFLIDCGMFQGSDYNEYRNQFDFKFDPKEIKALFVTHAHIDHSGRIPKLVREGFKGRIYTTKGTADFLRLIWEDALTIMLENNKRYDSPILYNQNDIEKALDLCHCVEYNETKIIAEDLRATWKDAGHIFGAAFIELELEKKKIVFSGDIGNENVPILKDTQPIDQAQTVICESTYGDRVHENEKTRKEILLELIKNGLSRGGTIMIPAFSLERTQEILYLLNELSEQDKVLPKVPIFLDSPLAIKATKVYNKYPNYYDQEALNLYAIDDNFLEFPNLKKTPTVGDSKKINAIQGPKIIIAGSGMMTGGRIIHHALRYLSDPKSTLIIVGYQAAGTLGRKLYEGQKKVKILDQSVEVKCTIKAIGALSAHGDQQKLLKWIGTTKKL